jgi:PAS domain-containing protein
MVWLFFPPVFSFMFLMFSAVLHNKAAAVEVPYAIWGMTIAAYICMCTLSLFFILQGENRFNYGISLLAQGLMMSVISLQFGVIFMSWIGLVMFMAGLVTMFSYAAEQRSSPYPAMADSGDDRGLSYKKLDDVLEKLSVAVCHTDDKGVITNATTGFCEAVGKNIKDVAGQTINDLIPTDSEEVALESGKWRLTQEHDGVRSYFSLKPMPDAKPERPAAAETVPDERFIYDKSTGLYTDEYRKIRGPEELSRALKYKRPLSGLLVAASFEPSGGIEFTREQEEMLNNTFKARVHAMLQNTDCGFLTADGRVQILLPETPQSDAKTFLSHIAALPQDIFDEDVRTAVKPKVNGGLLFYNGASPMEYETFSAELEEAFVDSMDEDKSTTPNNQAA